MGCLNSTGKFAHWFGNIHLSGPCNRKCYFCIGQHMMELDALNNLKQWPLLGLDAFLSECLSRDVTEVNVTGTNTEPLLYSHTRELVAAIRAAIPDVSVGVRTNGAMVLRSLDDWRAYDHASVTICSFDPAINARMMGPGDVPDITAILNASTRRVRETLKVNVVLGPENVGLDVLATLARCASAGIHRVNLREPYGQPHIGDPLQGRFEKIGEWYGMPTYDANGVEATYWDVHFCEVESVNLYANGRISNDYPITRGHSDSGEVKDQSQFPGGRTREQWVTPEHCKQVMP